MTQIVKTDSILMAVVIALGFTTTATTAGPIYSNDFENVADPLTEWSVPRVDLTPGTAEHPLDRFLGQFINEESTTLTLEGLTPNTQITISFDLYVIRSWDGNHTPYNGPDEWWLDANDITLLHTTFSNQGYDQAYPDAYPGGSNPPRTGADESNTLGFTYASEVKDTVYYFRENSVLGDTRFTFNLGSASTLELTFSGHLKPDNDDESWGIDNIVVIPEPTTLSLLLLGGVVALKRRR